MIGDFARRRSIPLRPFCVVLVLLLTVAVREAASEPEPAIPAPVMISGDASSSAFVEEFEAGRPGWIASDKRAVVSQRRQSQLAHDGESAEYIRLTGATGRAIELLYPIPACQVLAEPTATVWVRATAPDLRVGFRLRLPRQIDPRTAQPLTCSLPGDALTDTSDWSQLTVSADEAAIADRLRRLRAELGPRLSGGKLDTTDMQVDAVVLQTGHPGEIEILTDQLTVGPIVEASSLDITISRGKPPLQVRSGRATLNGRPFFPIATPDHGESIDSLRQSGVNLVWIGDYTEDTPRTNALRAAGIGVMATPPQSRINGEIAEPSVAVPRPFDQATEDVLLWMLGLRIPGEQLEDVRRVVGQIDSSDRLYDLPRPIAADVMDRSRAYSRRLSVVGSSEPVLHTSRSPLEFYWSLGQAKHAALPGSLHMTWIATEPSPKIAAARQPGTDVPIVEPEQIWMQAQLALAAGYRGLGFWKRTPLDDPTVSPAADERRLAVSLYAMRLRLLQRWLATSDLSSTEDITIGSVESSPNDFAARSAVGTRHPYLKAAVLRSDEGLLVLPTWIPAGGQHVPGRMVAQNARVRIPGWDNLHGYEVTTTGLRPLKIRRVAGGSEIEVGTIDQHTVLLLTSSTYMPLVKQLEADMQAIRPAASAAWIELATAKLDRVAAVDQQLAELRVPQPRGVEANLAAARSHVAMASRNRQRGDHSHARQQSRYALQRLRSIQRAYWEAAVRSIASATASPHAVCFQTLPSHYRMVQKIAASPLVPQVAMAGHDTTSLTGASPYLAGGSFDDAMETDSAGWQEIPVARDDVKTEVSLRSVSTVPTIVQSGTAPSEGRCLSMKSVPSPTPPAGQPPLRGRTLVVRSPSVEVQTGDAIELTAKMLVTPGSRGVVYDSIGGPLLAVTIDSSDRWQTIRLMREASDNAAAEFTFELHGTGELLIDDVRLRHSRTRPVPPQAVQPVADEKAVEPKPKSRFIPDFRKLPLWNRE